MNRFASAIVRVSFEGPDLSDEALYRLLRVCCTLPSNSTKLSNPHRVAIRPNLGYHTSFSSPSWNPEISSNFRPPYTVRHLRPEHYTCPEGSGIIVNHAPQNILCSAHSRPCCAGLHSKSPQNLPPRIILPSGYCYICRACAFSLVLDSFLKAVQIFDPIRVFMVEGKVNDWFDYKRKP